MMRETARWPRRCADGMAGGAASAACQCPAGDRLGLRLGVPPDGPRLVLVSSGQLFYAVLDMAFTQLSSE